MSIAFSVLPIIFTLLCGYFLLRTGYIPRADWRGVEVLSFRLLIPAVLIKFIATSELNVSEFLPMILTVIASVSMVGFSVLLLRKFRTVDSLPNPSLSTLFQTTTRWNAFITLVAVELFVGEEGVVLVAVAMATMIPLINVANIIVLSVYGKAKASFKNIVVHVLKNPIVLSCIIGLSINVLDIELSVPVSQTLDIIGRAAIGIGLLAVGAGIDPSRLFKSSLDMWLGISLRLIVIPLLFISLAVVMELGHIETLVGVLILAVPSASNGYIVAKQMGGNSELYADILAWQVILSMVLLPVYLAYLL